MPELVITLLLAAALGYLAQSTGLCMVRGMKEWMGGRPRFMAAILCSGVLAWVSGMLAEPLGYSLPFQRSGIDGWFALGGLLFGMGAAFNQGCGVSTLTKLSRGELEMVATISGWLAGWYLLERWGPQVIAKPVEGPGLLIFAMLAGISIFLALWLIRGKAEHRKIWLGMMGIGLLSGFMFLLERGWAPSSLLHELSAALRGEHESPWPSLGRYLIIISLLVGMFYAGWRMKRIQIRRPSAKVFLMHLLAGTLMGIGAALAKGGNTSQLLLALPVFSTAAAVAVSGMLVGLYLGLALRKMLHNRNLERPS